MADIPDYDPTKDDTGAAGGARGGDDDTQDYNLPGGPTDSPEEQRRKWYQRGARPKDQYRYKPLPHDDEDIPMSKLPDEKNGLLSTPKNTDKTSFIEGTPSGRIMTAAEQMATREVEQDFPFMDHNRVEVRYNATGRGTGSIIEIKMRNKTEWYPLFNKNKGGHPKNFQQKSSQRNPISTRSLWRG